MSGVTLLHASSPSACLVRSLGLVTTSDRMIGAATGAVRLAWSADDQLGMRAQLAPLESDATGLRVELGHQGSESADETRCCCPIIADDLLDPRPPPNVRLGAVAIPINSANEVLLTRRPRLMRTFPGAWVLPGGSVDREDESVVHAALRELEEETGLKAPLDACEQPAPLCLWESCFPVSFDEWAAQRKEGVRRTAHFLISFVVVRVGSVAPLRLQPAECDAAVWVPLGDVAAALCGDGSATSAECYAAAPMDGVDGTTVAPVKPQQLAGVYPNALGEGVGRGHLWALRRLLRRLQSVSDQ